MFLEGWPVIRPAFFVSKKMDLRNKREPKKLYRRCSLIPILRVICIFEVQ